MHLLLWNRELHDLASPGDRFVRRIRQFEIEFLDVGVETFAFTFG